MSVYIRGMEMPESCEDCIFFTSKPVSRCTLIGNIISSFDDDRLSDCPMVEVTTPHGRLIDADGVLAWWCEEEEDSPYVEDVHNAPTIIEAEE